MLSLRKYTCFIEKSKNTRLILVWAVFSLSASSCVPKKGGGEGGVGRSTTDQTPLFTVFSMKVGGSNIPPTDSSGTYFSKYDPLSIAGACRGGVASVQVAVTPLSQSTVTETVPCTSTLYSWSKSLTTETSYVIVLTPLDENSQQIPELSPVTKNYVYDVTDPAPPAFLTPTTGTSYSVNNGQTSFTITGQVLNEVSELNGPGMTNIPLVSNADGIHKDFSYPLTVPVGSTVNATFNAYDGARNTSSSSMSIQSVLNLAVPMAAAESGGIGVTGGLLIHSSVGPANGISLNSSLKFITGAAGIVGNNP